MFTGIIEEVGTVKYFKQNSYGAEFEIECLKVLKETKVGDSICVNGVCETVTEITSNTFKAEISDETLQVTTFCNLKMGVKVNLERALNVNSRLGGHIVYGHVDCKGKLVKVQKLADFYNISFEIPKNYIKYIVYKGSITVNGISLTVAEIYDNIIKIAVIPHTYNSTVLKYLSEGDSVNIETDILAKYVEKMLSAGNNKENHISMEFLSENGFV